MPLQYSLDTSLQQFEHVLDNYLSWFRSLSDFLSDPAIARSLPVNEVPPSFVEWLNVVEKNQYATLEEIKKIKSLSQQVHGLVERSMKTVEQTKERLPHAQHKMLNILFDEFVKIIHSIDKTSRISNIGIDGITGLRTYKAMQMDIDNELKRLARQGIQFTVAMVRIDFYRELVKNQTKVQLESILKTVAYHILESLRPYDDAYRLDEGEFLLSMKQTDVHGGVAGLQRLYSALQQENLMVTTNTGLRPLTVSSCVAEPIPEDDVDKLLSFLREDILHAAEGSGSLIEYSEVSAIERYGRSMATDLMNAKAQFEARDK